MLIDVNLPSSSPICEQKKTARMGVGSLLLRQRAFFVTRKVIGMGKKGLLGKDTYKMEVSG